LGGYEAYQVDKQRLPNAEFPFVHEVDHEHDKNEEAGVRREGTPRLREFGRELRESVLQECMDEDEGYEAKDAYTGRGERLLFENPLNGCTVDVEALLVNKMSPKFNLMAFVLVILPLEANSPVSVRFCAHFWDMAHGQTTVGAGACAFIADRTQENPEGV
jgi:hypothetical protein